MKKVEYEKELKTYKDLMEEILYCLNQVKNTKVQSKNFTSTYDICRKIGKFVNQ